MPRKLIKKYTPDAKKIQEQKSLRFLQVFFSNPSLWHINRRSTARAFAVGLFWAMIPVPFQMVFSALCAIPLKANIPLSVALVWITNPLTMPPIFYLAYLIGSSILGVDGHAFAFEMTTEWFSESLAVIWKPFLLGCFVLGVSAATLGYATIEIAWRIHTFSRWKRRNLQ